MNGKFILLLVISINIVSLMITAGFETQGQADNSEIGNNYIFTAFFSPFQTSEFNNQTQLAFSSNTTGAIEDLGNQQATGASANSLTGGFSFIIDALKMLGAFILLLTPIPLLAFFGSIGFPLWLQVVLVAPVAVMYALSLAEFVGNRNF